MNNYTVILLYPDYLSYDYPSDQYLHYALANTAKEAVEQAQSTIFLANQEGSILIRKQDFKLLWVFNEHVETNEEDWT